MAQLNTWHTYWCLWWQTSNHHHWNWHAQKPISGNFQVILSSSSRSKRTLCIFQKQMWLLNRKCYGKNKLYFDQEYILKMAWYSTHLGFWTCQFQWHWCWDCTFRCFWIMGYMYALSWKLLIIGLLSEYFATLLIRLHLKKIATKYSIFLHQLYIFLMGRSRTFWGRRYCSNFIWGGQKEGVGGEWEERAKMRCFVYKIPIIKWDTNLISQTVGQTNFSPPPFQLAHSKTNLQRLWSDFDQFFPVKNNFVYFKEQIWLPNRKCYGKI